MGRTIMKSIILSSFLWCFTAGLLWGSENAQQEALITSPVKIGNKATGQIVRCARATVCNNTAMLTQIFKMYLRMLNNNKSFPAAIQAVGPFSHTNSVFNEAIIDALYQYFEKKHGQLYIAIALQSPGALRWIKKHKPNCAQEMLIPDEKFFSSPLTLSVTIFPVFTYLEQKSTQALASKDKNRYTPFTSAVATQSVSVLSAIGERVKQLNLLDVPDKQGNTALMHAVNLGNTKLVQKVLSYGPLVNVKNNLEQDALNIALDKFTRTLKSYMDDSVVEDVQSVAEANRKKYLPIVKLLLVHKANPNSPNSNGTLPLFTCLEHCALDEAEYTESIELLEALIKAGANCAQKNKYNQSVQKVSNRFDRLKAVFNAEKKNTH